MPLAQNLTGQTFGRLTVVDWSGQKSPQGHFLWRCLCICGRDTLAAGYSLKAGNTKSCGCWRTERIRSLRGVDLAGKTFGRLRVIERVSSVRGQGRATTWKCRCVCGQEKMILTGDLQTGRTRSCGCLLTEFIVRMNKARRRPDAEMRDKRSAQWREARTACFKRDNYTCQLCGEHGGRLNADHIKRWSKFPDLRFELSNLRTLCEACHKQTPNYGGRKAA